MIKNFNQKKWDQLNPMGKRLQLYYNQVHLLDEFLKHGAISEKQYQKSFHDLMEKMEIQKLKETIQKDTLK